jgi:hypothetical protein
MRDTRGRSHLTISLREGRTIPAQKPAIAAFFWIRINLINSHGHVGALVRRPWCFVSLQLVVSQCGIGMLPEFASTLQVQDGSCTFVFH